MKQSTKILIMGLCMAFVIGTLAIIFAPEPPENIIVQHPVETVEFVIGEYSSELNVFIKTDRESFLVPDYNIDFIREVSNETLTLDEVKYTSARSTFGVEPYTLHIPEAQVDTISNAYTKAFGEKLEFKKED